MLTTLQRVHAFDDVSAFQGLALECLAAASEEFESLVGRTLESTAYAGQYVTGDGTQRLYLPNWPVTAVTSLEVSESALTVPPLTDGAADADQETYLPPHGEYLLMRSGVWPEDNLAIKISYTAGHSVIPEYIQSAVVLMTHLLLKERKRVGDGAKTMGDLSVQTVVRKYSEYPQVLNAVRRARMRRFL